MRRSPRPRFTLLLASLVACNDSGSAVDPTSTATTATSSSSDVTVPPTTTTNEITGTTQASDFIPFPDLDLDLDCDIFAQDCRPGQKCVPWADNGGAAWNATRCVPVTGDGAPGEACTAPDGPTAGVDDCSAAAICWDVGPGTQGTCVAQCTGDPDDPSCPPQYACAGDYTVLAVCLPTCDPLADDCPGDQVCIPANHGFLCAVAGNSGQVNDPCVFANNCDAGLACLDAAIATAACQQRPDGCCQPFCKFPDAPCPNPDQQCVQWYDPMMPIPAGYEDLGVCAIPE